jgi:hypothetical protein
VLEIAPPQHLVLGLPLAGPLVHYFLDFVLRLWLLWHASIA